MTLPQPDHPLTEDEIELYDSCARAWGDPGFAMGSWRTSELRNVCRQSIEQLARIFGVTVEFQLMYDQHYVYATRPRAKKAP